MFALKIYFFFFSLNDIFIYFDGSLCFYLIKDDIIQLKITFFQETLLKVKSVLVDEKKQIRFGDWSANDVGFFFSLLEKQLKKLNH